ncbi:unnamed protein product [Brachionus calyciflorus]|uniref:Uncharacterized protein n=1 Tax=Brachionus calyciflorus TaxID=104777 RepID=A0A814DKB8_9BILA|nr:unnamed protein product [Brachionus calyciflorus]
MELKDKDLVKDLVEYFSKNVVEDDLICQKHFKKYKKAIDTQNSNSIEKITVFGEVVENNNNSVSSDRINDTTQENEIDSLYSITNILHPEDQNTLSLFHAHLLKLKLIRVIALQIMLIKESRTT